MEVWEFGADVFKYDILLHPFFSSLCPKDYIANQFDSCYPSSDKIWASTKKKEPQNIIYGVWQQCLFFSAAWAKAIFFPPQQSI